MVLPNPRPGLPYSPVPTSIAAHFSTFPLAAPYLDPSAHSSAYKPMQTDSRIPKPDTEDTLFSSTLFTASTIPYLQSFYLPRSSPGRARPTIHFSEARNPAGELHILLSLSSGLNGKDGLIHGGLLSVLFDELVTLLANFHREDGTEGYTATLKVDYKAPVKSPGMYLMRGWFDGRTVGRKCWVGGELVGWDEGREVLLAKAEGLVVDVKKGAKL